MKKHLLIITSLAFVGIASSAFIINNVKDSSGKAGYTGSPGESTCASCHSGGAGTTSVTITGSPAFTNNQYIPGQTYTVNVTVSNATLNKFGFGCEILNGTVAGSTNAGTITAITSGGTKVLTSGGKKNAVHISTTTGTGNSYTFMFKWVAPASGTAAIFAVGNAVNGNSNDGTGDFVKANTLGLTANVTGLIALENVMTNLNVFPNPVIDNINLRYSLINEAKVKASIYSLQGKEVAVLFNDEQSAGNHTKTSLVSQNLNAGVYLLKISINGKDAGEKLLIKQ